MATGGLSVRREVPAQQALLWADLAGRLTVADLPSRDLEPAELQDLVSTVASEEATWAHLVAFDAHRRVYACLHRDAHVDIWLLCWTPENDTGWHDHDISAGAVAVVTGALTEYNLHLGGGSVATGVEAGRVFSFSPDHIHRLTGAVPGSVSVHAYSPPLWRMGQYVVTEDGILRRTSVSYADELRPIQ
jgi:predicted metal-dependent enzyme (double-stranded beta helix superfamily)